MLDARSSLVVAFPLQLFDLVVIPSYCGPEAPKFEKSDFENGKARWLVIYNNTGHSQSDLQTELELESPTIGYRSK